MNRVSNRVSVLEDSQTLLMAQKSRDLKAKGIDVINLSLGEPDFDTPDYIKEAAFEGIRQNFTHYSPVGGFDDLRKVISEKLKRENGLDYPPSQIVVSNGAKQSLANVILSIVDHGDEVIVPAPYWVSYVEQVKLAGADPVVVHCDIEQDFKITPAQLRAAITPRTKAFLFCSPCNPTGSIYSKEELLALTKVFEEFPEVFIISDEIYEHINFIGKHESIAQFGSIKDRVILINGVSKGYAMTGWRIGYAAGPAWVVKACLKLQGQTTSGPCSISQRASLAALKSDGEFTANMCREFMRRRDIVMAMLDDIPGVRHNLPEGAFYVFVHIASYFGKSYDGKVIQTDNDLVMFLLEHAEVALVDGSAFGDSNYLRISYAASEDHITRAMTRIREALAKLV